MEGLVGPGLGWGSDTGRMPPVAFRLAIPCRCGSGSDLAPKRRAWSYGREGSGDRYLVLADMPGHASPHIQKPSLGASRLVRITSNMFVTTLKERMFYVGAKVHLGVEDVAFRSFVGIALGLPFPSFNVNVWFRQWESILNARQKRTLVPAPHSSVWGRVPLS